MNGQIQQQTKHYGLVDIIKALCKSRGTSIPKLENELDFGHGSIYAWKKRSPSIDKLLKVASYLNVSILQLIHDPSGKEVVPSTPVEPTELEKLQAAFDEVVQIRLTMIKRDAAYGESLPRDPVAFTPLLIAVNTEAHMLYWKGLKGSTNG